jgi:hypothetical protein
MRFVPQRILVGLQRAVRSVAMAMGLSRIYIFAMVPVAVRVMGLISCHDVIGESAQASDGLTGEVGVLRTARGVARCRPRGVIRLGERRNELGDPETYARRKTKLHQRLARSSTPRWTTPIPSASLNACGAIARRCSPSSTTTRVSPYNHHAEHAPGRPHPQNQSTEPLGGRCEGTRYPGESIPLRSFKGSTPSSMSYSWRVPLSKPDPPTPATPKSHKGCLTVSIT